MSKKFFKTVLKVIVLTEGAPIGEGEFADVDLHTVSDLTFDGPAVGDVKVEKKEELTGKQMADALKDADSDPSFFNLTEDGEENE